MPFGLAISRELIDQIQEEAGVPRTFSPAASPPGGAKKHGLSPATAALVGRNRELEQAVTRSRKVGGLLLKNEEAEAAAVQQHAQSLLAQGFAPSARAPTCLSERDACTQCYQQHPGDELQCRSAAASYEECARQAQARLIADGH